MKVHPPEQIWTIVETIHERSLRFVLDDYTHNYVELLSLLERPSMYLDRISRILILAFKTINHIGPSFLSEYAKIQNTPYNLRGGSMLVLPKYNTIKYGKNSVLFEMSSLWNKLSSNIKMCEDVNEFKSMLASEIYKFNV